MTAKPAPQTRIAEERIEIQASPDAIWKALTDSVELTRWFPLEAGENPDGTGWMGWRDQFRFSGRVDESVPQRLLRTSPIFPAGFEPPAKMATDFYLETADGKTVVRVVQSGFLADASWDEELDGVRRGWFFQLRALKHYLENHLGAPRHVAWARKLIAVPQAEAWQRVTGPRGIAANLADASAGSPFSFTTVDGDSFSGALMAANPPLDFCGTVVNWNNALLRVQSDRLPMRGYADAQLWLSTYGVPSAKVAALESRWVQMLDRIFPEPVKPPSRG